MIETRLFGLPAAAALAAHADAGRVQTLAASIAEEAQSRAQVFQASPAAPAEAPAPGDPLLAQLTDFALAPSGTLTDLSVAQDTVRLTLDSELATGDYTLAQIRKAINDAGLTGVRGGRRAGASGPLAAGRRVIGALPLSPRSEHSYVGPQSN